MKNRNRIWLLLVMIIFVLAFPVSANAAFTVKKSGVTVPTTLKVGSTFSIRGTLKSNKKLKKITCTIYKGNVCVQRYERTISKKKTYNLALADPYLIFDKLTPGTYYYRISVWNTSNKKKRVVNKKFTVKGDGTAKIANPKPDKDFSLEKGKGYVISGKITSTYPMKSITAAILDVNGKVLQTKTVKPNVKTYDLSSIKTLDNAMEFNKLAVGTYKFKLTVVDSQGTAFVLVYRTLTVKSTTTNTTPASTGSSTTTTGSLNYTGTVVTPAGYVARKTRPAASNKYYYNGTYNIYYKYDSLAPTGKVYYGSNYVTGNCTWYACGRAMEIVANAGGDITKVQQIFGGDPVGIYQANVSLGKFKYDMIPSPGSLAIFNYGGSSGDAHIAVVEAVVNGVPYVSESGYTISTTAPLADKSNIVFWYQSIYNWCGNRQLLGYIHLV